MLYSFKTGGYSMKFIRRLIVLVIGIQCCAQVAVAQNEEYLMELGGALGGSFYMGDANSSKLYKNTGLAGGVIARYILNPRMAIKGNLIAGKISGNTENFENVYPGSANVKFARTVFDLGAQFEYNFLGYSSEEDFRGNKRFTPYILGGLGITFAPASGTSVFTPNIPIGVGVKYKVASRINLGCEFTMRFTLSDKLDVTRKDGLQLNDPYQIKGKGFKNKDSYSFTVFYITYDMFPRCKGCNY